MVTARSTVVSEVGLHARPASLFVRSANQFQAEIRIKKLDRPDIQANAKSILEILALGVGKGDQVELSCEGDDEVQAAALLQRLIDEDFPELVSR